MFAYTYFQKAQSEPVTGSSPENNEQEVYIMSLQLEIKELKQKENEFESMKSSYVQLQKELQNLQETVKLKDESLQQMASGLAAGITERTASTEVMQELQTLQVLVCSDCIWKPLHPSHCASSTSIRLGCLFGFLLCQDSMLELGLTKISSVYSREGDYFGRNLTL